MPPDPISEARLATMLAEQTDLARRMRWDPREGVSCWRVWDGRHWATCPSDRLPEPLLQELRVQIGRLYGDRAVTSQEVRALERHAAIGGISQLLRSHTVMHLTPPFDPPGVLIVPAGALDLNTGHLLGHDPQRSVMRHCRVDPRPGSPQWQTIASHLERELGDNLTAVQRYFGRALLGLPPERSMLYLYGPGGSGKSTLMRIILDALGSYAAVIAPETICRGGRVAAHGKELLTRLFGPRLAIALEVEGDLDWPLIKSLTGGDAQVAKRLYQHTFTFDVVPSLVLVSNRPPEPPDEASADRILAVCLGCPEDPDERLVQTLGRPGQERDALLAAGLDWMIAGCTEYLKAGRMLGPHAVLRPPSIPRQWWQDRTSGGRLTQGSGWSSQQDLFEDYQRYCQLHGAAIDRHQFSRFLKSTVPTARRANGWNHQVTLTPC